MSCWANVFYEWSISKLKVRRFFIPIEKHRYSEWQWFHRQECLRYIFVLHLALIFPTKKCHAERMFFVNEVSQTKTKEILHPDWKTLVFRMTVISQTGISVVHFRLTSRVNLSNKKMSYWVNAFCEQSISN